MTPDQEEEAKRRLMAWTVQGNKIADEYGPLPDEYQPLELYRYWLSAEDVQDSMREECLLFGRLVERLKFEGVPDVDMLVREVRQDLRDIESLTRDLNRRDRASVIESDTP